MPIWSLCHLPTDGKEPAAFAVCQQMAKSRALCRLPANGKESCPLPSATDGKGLFAVRCKKQTAKKAFADPFFAGALCRLPTLPLPSAMADGKIPDSCSVRSLYGEAYNENLYICRLSIDLHLF